MNKSLAIGFGTGILAVFVVLLIPHVFPAGLTATVAAAVPATTSTSVGQGIACGRSAIDARENAIVKANAAYQQAENAAYATRVQALDAAYTQTTWAGVNTATTNAFSAFSTSITAAATALKAADAAAASSYTTSIKACQAANSTFPV